MFGQCVDFCKAFKKRFPELRIAKGWCNGREHWWLVLPDGTIYDPTVDQFGTTKLKYREVDPDVDKVYVGKCMNCGGEIYGLMKNGRKSICSEECRLSFENYLNS